MHDCSRGCRAAMVGDLNKSQWQTDYESEWRWASVPAPHIRALRFFFPLTRILIAHTVIYPYLLLSIFFSLFFIFPFLFFFFVAPRSFHRIHQQIIEEGLCR